MEQELVRAEAQSLVAEAQLTNITRQKLKEAYDIHTAAIIERAEKQIILAKNARKLLNLLDDTPVVPGDVHQPFEHSDAARDVLNTAEEDLRNWQPNTEPIHSNAGGLGSNAMPGRSYSPDNAQAYQTTELEHSISPQESVSAHPVSEYREPVRNVEQEVHHSSVNDAPVQSSYSETEEAVPASSTGTYLKY